MITTLTPMRAAAASALLTGLVLLAGALPRPAHAGVEIETWETGDGLAVYHVRTSALPMVDLRLLFDAGSARDGEHKGIAQLTNSLLSEGADGLDGGELARRFEAQGARFSTDVGRDSAQLSLRTLNAPQTLSRAVDAFTLVAGSPDFPQEALERERRRMLTRLRNNQQDPGYVGRVAYWEALYGDHPYATPIGGTEEGLAGIEHGAVVEFFETHYVADNATLAIVGDVGRAQAETIAGQISGALGQGAAPEALPDPEPPEQAGETIRIPFSTAQSHVLMGQQGYARGDEQHVPLYVGNHVLGGSSGLTSLLGKEMREERGLSYAIHSRFSPMKSRGPFVVSTQVRSDRTEEALGVLRETVTEFRAEGPDDDQLDEAVRNITGSFPLELDSNSSILSYVGLIGFHGLQLDYLDRFPEWVEAVTREEVRDAMQERLDPDAFVTVVVGPEVDEADE